MIELYVPFHQDCCLPFHEGSWAHTAVEVALARLSALILGNEDFLVASTHPESLGMIGSRRQLARSLHRQIRMYQMASPQRMDLCHGEGRGTPESPLLRGITGLSRPAGDRGAEEAGNDSWIVAMALQYVDSAAGNGLRSFVEIGRYLKHEGQWLFLGNENSLPNAQPFQVIW